MLSLTIHHNIYLTREQRYALHTEQEVVAVGVSVPVWYMSKITSEPAKEVFCKYTLKNPKRELPVQIMEDGYEISLPFREGVGLDITDEEWRRLLRDEPDKLEEMYRKMVQEVSSRNLLDIADGGSESLSYRELNKVKRGEQFLNIMHFINIEKIEKLTDSLVTLTDSP